MKEFFIKKVFAQAGITIDNPNPNPGSGITVENTDKITNPLGINDISGLLDLILSIIITLGTPLIAIMIVYAGFLYLTAQGNTDKISKAHTALLYTVIGAAIILGSFVIKEAIQGTITNLNP